MSLVYTQSWLDKASNKAEEIRQRYDNRIADLIVKDLYANAEEIARKAVVFRRRSRGWDKKLDDILTSRRFGYPVMVALLGAVFWLTIVGANYPSDLLALLFSRLQEKLTWFFSATGLPDWFHGVMVLGLFAGLASVVAVMLPPMAIFFPLFTLLEDLGYLPRVAFNLDHIFKRCGACGKQALTMCMGFGCNAAGVVSCRIIDSPRERIMAILTNNFVPCNGRFPILIAIGTVFFAGTLPYGLQSAAAAGVVTAMVVLGVLLTFGVSWLLSQTILRGEPSSMVLELPPYRMPQLLPVIYRSIIDRTVFVLRRAVIMAAPAGALTWVLANTHIGDFSILAHIATLLQPLGQMIGLDGFILLAFVLGLPANEIVIPILLMMYLSTGRMVDFASLEELRQVLINNGWTWLTAVNMMLFTLLHWPCTTTLLTVYKESGSKKWTAMAFLIPTVTAFLVCFMVTQAVRLLGLV
ncbi:MAG: ferrous iron transporter B [Syntrophomonadaceae bacterium]|nr:ferrous iron transporter B [Syntrophomonadaceae bacterium]